MRLGLERLAKVMSGIGHCFCALVAAKAATPRPPAHKATAPQNIAARRSLGVVGRDNNYSVPQKERHIPLEVVPVLEIV